MNINGIETLLIGTVASALIAAFVIYMRRRARKLHKIPHTPTFRQSAPTFLGTKLKAVNPRRKVELKPIITGYLPIYPIARPAAPLS